MISNLGPIRSLIGVIVFNECVVVTSALAEEPWPLTLEVEEQIDFTLQDLEQITSQVIATYPFVSSSPGVKYAAVRAARSYEFVNVLYYPHTEAAGHKQALQVGCRRCSSAELWTCGRAGIRGYLQVAGQDFEVRVLDGVEAGQALALIEATRPLALTNPNNAPEVPQTAISVGRMNDTAIATWGSSRGHQTLTLAGSLIEDGDPNDKDDWQVSVYKYPK